MMRRGWVFVFLGLVATALVAEPRALRVTLVVGEAEVFDESRSAVGWRKVSYGLLVGPDQRLRTGVNSRLELADDRIRLKVGPRSVVRVADLTAGTEQDTTVLEVLAGRLWSAVGRLARGHAVELKTTVAVVGVRGTEFAMLHEAGVSTVMVFKGEVEFRPASGGPTVVVPAGRMSVMRPEGPTAPEPIPVRSYQEWGLEVPPDALEGSSERRPAEPEWERRPAPESSSAQTAAPAPEAVRPSPDTAPAKPVTVATDRPKQEERREPPKPPKPSFGMKSSLGPVSIDGKTWQQVVLMPEFGLGPFGIGVYLPFYLDLSKPVFPNTSWYNYAEWDYRGWEDGVKDTLGKLLYLRWGQKGDRLFVKVGSIDDMTLGYGFVVRRFSNMLEFPVVRRLGLQFDVDFGGGGFETMTEDVFLFRIYGGRVYVRPFASVPFGPVSRFSLGYVHVVDTAPSGLPAYHESLGVHGPDVGTAVLSSPIVNLEVYAAAATAWLGRKGETLRGHRGWVAGTGVRGDLVGWVRYGLEYRHLVNGFVAEYFDPSYMAVRQERFAEIRPGFFAVTRPDASVLLGRLGVGFGKYGAFDVAYWAAMDAKDDNLLFAELEVAKGVLPKVSGKARVEKRDIVSFRDLWDNFLDERTVLMAEGVFSPDNVVDIAFVVKRTYLRKENGAYEPLTTVGLETRFGFF